MNKITPKPWGEEEVIYKSGQIKCKLLRVKADQSLSLQFHQEKIEFMICVKGQANFILGNDIYNMSKNKHFLIKPMQRHRILAITDCEVVELSCGSDRDIIRLQDFYERK